MPILDMKEMGIGLAAAVLIDATIVRAVLLPASMKLLGDGTGTCRAGSSGCPGWRVNESSLRRRGRCPCSELRRKLSSNENPPYAAGFLMGVPGIEPGTSRV